MRNLFEKFSEFQKSVLLSVGFHIMLIALFALIKSGLDLPDTEFAEIGFVATTTSRAYKPAPQKSAPAKQKAETAVTQRAQPVTAPKEEAKAPPVNIPKRRMIEDEEPQLTRRKSGKLSPTADETKPTPRDDVYDAEAMRKEVSDKSSSEKDFTQPGGRAMDGNDGATPASDIGAASANMPYTIEGDAAKRSIVNQVLPEYPPGLQQEAVVKIRFWVLPDGRIGSMIPVRKGDPVLDQVTMRAIRQWRFNALPTGSDPKNAEGVITFVYRLR
jgi:TonB family protein